MNIKPLTFCTLIPTFILGTLLSTAVAAPRGIAPQGDSTSARGDDHSQTTERGPELSAEVVLLGAHTTGRQGHGVYDIAVNGRLVTVELDFDRYQGALSIYDARGKFIVGYVAGRRGAALFDTDGLVDRSAREPLSMAPMEDYGLAAMLVSDPFFLFDFLAANGIATGGDDDTPPGLWWVLVAKCLNFEAEVSGNSDGYIEWSFSLGWDC